MTHRVFIYSASWNKYRRRTD